MQNWQAKGRVNRPTTIILSVYGQTGPKGYLDRGIARLPLGLPISLFPSSLKISLPKFLSNFYEKISKGWFNSNSLAEVGREGRRWSVSPLICAGTHGIG